MLKIKRERQRRPVARALLPFLSYLKRGIQYDSCSLGKSPLFTSEI